ncbi:N-acetylmuramoyl-L-alanine amidase [uncultured Croceitalea sp.]|uniref:N-acetylmuramoyl-L-alanine amidase family protein n=1 Tax=uncultured Croceitalea sp. TaxID=1798908 RepID=UPI003306669E
MIKNRILSLALCLLFLLNTSFIKNNTEAPTQDKFVVVLDAGHGGHDPGNLGNGYLEKNIALAIVLKVGELLEGKKDIEVIYTRQDDTFVDLFERGEIANKANANLFVSVHCDSHTSDANGAGTFVLGLHANKQNFDVAKKENSVIYLEDNYEQKYAKYDINSPESVIGLTIMQEEFLEQSIQLAKLMQDNFAGKLKRKDRKVKQAGFIVLHQTFMPSVLVETGFLTNKGEGSYLNSAKGQNEMGTAIANAILSYKDGVDANLIELSDTIVEQKTPEKEEISKEIKEKVTIAPPKEEAITEVVEKPSIPEVKTKTEVKKPQKMETVAVADVIFKVQLMASSKIIPLDGANFKGLNTLSKEPVKNLYRYMYGNTNSYLKAKLLKSNADAKGYTTSYIVAYKNGNRIPLHEAIKSVPVQ